MDFYKKEWLPHLKDSIPPEAKRNRISLYTIALEGYRRGLRLKFYNMIDQEKRSKLIFSLSNHNNMHCFYESSGDHNTDEAFAICENKALTDIYLEKHQVPTPKGKVFTKNDSINDIINYARKLKYPLVVKPTNGNGGKGVFANIKNEQQLIEAVKENCNKHNYREIIVQKYVIGDEVRVYVLNNKVLAAVNRLPANIIGDGHHTVIQLIRNKNELRKKTPHLHHRPIRVDNEVKRLLEEANYNIDTVLAKGKRLYLRKISNVSIGGDPVDITDSLTETQRNIAIRATKSIPGLTHCGVDMIINQITGETVVLEVNTRPGIGSHLFPVEGNAKDIPKEIIDYYFPETINNKYRQDIYFDLQTVFDSLNTGMVNELEITSPPKEALETVKFEIISNLDTSEFYTRIKKYILEKNIHGRLSSINSKSLCLIAAHEERQTLVQFKQFLKQRKSFLQIESIQVENFNGPIKIGFDVADGLRTMSPLELETEYKQSIKEMKIMDKEVLRLRKRIKQIKTSSSWRIMAPFRYVTSKLKEKKP